MAEQMEHNRKVNQKFFNTFSSDLKEDNKNMLALLAAQRRAIKKIDSDLIFTIEKKADETGKKIAADLKKYELTIRGKKLALLLKDLIDLVENTWDSSLEITQNQKS